MYLIYLSFAIDTILILFTVFWIKTKSFKTENMVLAVSSEAPITVIMSIFSLGLSYFLLSAKWLDVALAGTDFNSYLSVGGFSVICALLGCFVLLYTYLKEYVILPDRLIVVNVFGIVKNFYWNEIKSVRIPLLSSNLIIKTKHGTCFIHSGNLKQYKYFIGILKNYIPRSSGENTVVDLYNRL